MCGHAKPDACVRAEEHLGAPVAHPCGPSDAADPEMANRTGAFCEIVNMTTTSEEGEVLIYGFEKLEFLEAAHEEAIAAGETPQVPVLQLEVVEAEHLMEILGLNTTEEMAMLADYDYELLEEEEEEEEEGADAEAPGPAPTTIITTSAPAAAPAAATAAATATDDVDDDESPAETRRRRRGRQLLRFGGGMRGGFGGMRGGGLRRGGIGRFGGVGGVGRFGRLRRNRGMLINQVLAPAYYGNRGRFRGGQVAFYNNQAGGLGALGK